MRYLMILLIPCLWGCFDNPQNAGGWIETTNGISQVQTKDSTGRVLDNIQAQILTAPNAITGGSAQIVSSNTQGNLLLQFSDSVRRVLVIENPNGNVVWTWIPGKDSLWDGRLHTQKYSIQGQVPIPFDSIVLLGTGRSAVVDSFGNYAFDSLAWGRYMALLRKGNQFTAAGIINVDTSGTAYEYFLTTCPDNPVYTGKNEANFLQLWGYIPNFNTTATEILIGVKSPSQDSIEMDQNDKLISTQSNPLDTISFVATLDSGANRLKFVQKGAWSACLNVSKP